MQLVQCNACGNWDNSDNMSNETFPRCSSCVAAGRPVVATCSCEKAADIEREIRKQFSKDKCPPGRKIVARLKKFVEALESEIENE